MTISRNLTSTEDCKAAPPAQVISQSVIDPRIDKIMSLLASRDDLFGDAFVSRKATDAEIDESERRLGVSIPACYRWYLKEIGHGGYFFEIMGYGINGKAIFAEETLLQRENGLPHNLLIIQNCDEYYDCIDASTGVVVTWSPYDQNGVVSKNLDFLDYLIAEIENAIENS